MKCFALAGALAICVGIIAQERGKEAVVPAPLATRARTVTPPPLVLQTNRAGSNWMWNGAPALTIVTNRRGNALVFESGKSRANTTALGNAAALRPGVYQTEPYSMIVVVPEKHLDEEIAVSTPELSSIIANSAMPVIKPELRFIPRQK